MSAPLVTGLDVAVLVERQGPVPGVFLNDCWGNADGGADLGHKGDLAWRSATVAGLAVARNLWGTSN